MASGDPGLSAIDWRRLLVEPLRLAVPPGHPLTTSDEVRLADAAGESWSRPVWAWRCCRAPDGVERATPTRHGGAERDIGVAWPAGRDLPSRSARFREHVLSRR